MTFDRERAEERPAAAVTDSRAGGRPVARRLDGRGRRDGYFANFDRASTRRERAPNLTEDFVAQGLALAARGRRDVRADRVRATTLATLAGSGRPTAVFAADDHMALAELDVLRAEIGPRVPVDVPVAGFDPARAGSERGAPGIGSDACGTTEGPVRPAGRRRWIATDGRRRAESGRNQAA